MRLTKKDIIYVTSGANVIQIPDIVEGHKYIGQAINKLGQLEDIEDELGIDLITLFKALKNGFYGTMYGLEKDIAIKHGSPLFYELKNVDIKRYSNNLAFIYYLGSQRLSYTDFLVYLWKDYGKTWALTKEELQ